MKRPRRPRDFAQLARLVVDIATGTVVESELEQATSKKATAGRLGGLTTIAPLGLLCWHAPWEARGTLGSRGTMCALGTLV